LEFNGTVNVKYAADDTGHFISDFSQSNLGTFFKVSSHLNWGVSSGQWRAEWIRYDGSEYESYFDTSELQLNQGVPRMPYQ
jgi:hypothetical protein